MILDGEKIRALINIRAEINVIQRNLTKKANLLIIVIEWVIKKNMRNINNRIIKFIGIVAGISVKISEILINNAIFMIKNDQIFEYLIFGTLFVITGQINFKSLNNSSIIIYIYNVQGKNYTIIKAVYAPSLMQITV